MMPLLLCILLTLLTPLSSWALSGLILSANYWPVYTAKGSGSAFAAINAEQAALGKNEWQSRAPWYCDQYPSVVNCDQTQDDMDLEIQMAAAAGISNFSFFWYGQAAGGVNYEASAQYQRSWDLYQASAYNTQLKWTLNVRLNYIGASPFSDTAQWHANVDQLVAYMQQSTYQKMGANRPVIFFFYESATLNTFFANSNTNLATAVAYLRSQATGAGLGDPYIVFQGIGAGVTGSTVLSTLGGDALSQYFSAGATFLPTSVAATRTYAAYDALVQAYWDTLSGGSGKIVPIIQPGQDIAGRLTTPPPWAAGQYFPKMGLNLVWTDGTPAAIATGQMAALGTWMDANPTKHDGVAWLYSWTEHMEGGTAALQPSIGDPPLSNPPYTGGASSGLTLKLNAIGPVLYGYR